MLVRIVDSADAGEVMQQQLDVRTLAIALAALLLPVFPRIGIGKEYLRPQLLMQVLHLRFALLRVAHSLEQKTKDVILDDVCMRETNASRIDDVKNRLGILVLRQLHAHEELIGVQIGRQLVHQRAPKIFRPRAQFLIEKVVAGHNRGFVFIPDVSAQITDPPLGMVHAALARIIRNLVALIHNQLECVAVKD